MDSWIFVGAVADIGLLEVVGELEGGYNVDVNHKETSVAYIQSDGTVRMSVAVRTWAFLAGTSFNNAGWQC